MPQLHNSSAPVGTFLKFVEFAKLDESEGKPTIYGIATWENPDSDNECCDYDAAVPVYKAWAAAAMRRTKKSGAELSMGNIRLMHGGTVGGKVTKIDYRDDAKEIALGSEPANDEIYKMLKGGHLTGYSQGGSYAWRECNECQAALPLQQANNFCPTCNKMVTVRYGLKRLAEVSYVDSPAIGEGFEHVKATGSCEIIKFCKSKEAPVAKTKTVAGVALPARCFAYVGDSEKTTTWKLPIEFPGDAEKTKAHVRNALALLEQTKGIPSDKKTEVKAKIDAAAAAHGIDVAVEHGKFQQKAAAIRADIRERIVKAVAVKHAAKAEEVTKGLYAVSRLADVLETLACLWEQACWERDIEGDDSDIPEELEEQLQSMIETFIAMAEEEARELAARTNKNTNQGAATMNEEELKKQQELEKAAKKSMATHFAKAASHHEKKADHHEAMAEEHTAMAESHKAMHEKCAGCMGKATVASLAKEDVGSGAEENGPIHAVLSDMQNHHKSAEKCAKAMAAHHGKMAKREDAFADHLHKMAESHDEETAKAVKAEMAKSDPAPTPAETAAAAAATPTMDDDVKKAAAAMRDTPEYKESIAAIAKAQVDAEVAKLRDQTLAPLGVSVGDGPNTNKTTAVRRGAEAESIELARPSSPSKTAGL